MPKEELREVLREHIRPETVDSVMRRPFEQSAGRSLLELAEDGENEQVRDCVDRMFRFGDAHA